MKTIIPFLILLIPLIGACEGKFYNPFSECVHSYRWTVIKPGRGANLRFETKAEAIRYSRIFNYEYGDVLGKSFVELKTLCKDNDAEINNDPKVIEVEK